MGGRASDADDSQEGLARLPSGRHGLPRSFVIQNQRDRLTAGMIAAVAEHGYQDATITQIAAAAGLSRRTFYDYYKSKQEGFYATYDQIFQHLLDAAAQAAARESEWAYQVRAVIAAVLEVFTANPDLARLTLVEPLRSGDRDVHKVRQAVDRILAEVRRTFPGGAAHPSPDIQRAMLIGMASLVASKVDAREGERLEDLLEDLVEIFLAPYVGSEEAARVSRGARSK